MQLQYKHCGDIKNKKVYQNKPTRADAEPPVNDADHT